MREVLPTILVVLIAGALLLAGCGQDERRNDNSDDVARVESIVDSLERRIAELESELERPEIDTRQLAKLLMDDRRGLWGADTDALYFEFKKSVTASDAATLVNLLNEAYPPPRFPGIDLVGVENDMAHIRVRDPLMFGTGMGSAGAWAYCGAIILTLTSLPQIDSVFIDFGPEYAPGNPDRRVLDHASPGVGSRVDYAQHVRLE